MAGNITINVSGAGKEVQSYTIQSGIKGNPALRITAKSNVNYQLIDDATGIAPEAVATKRVGKDLVVSFSGSLEEPDLIIENYYGDGKDGVESGSNSMLIGQYEDGQWYAYVPDSAQVGDAISMLAEEMSANQVLGGEALSNRITPMAAALMAGGVAMMALAVGGGGGGDTPPPPVKPEAGVITAPNNTNDNTPTITGTGATPNVPVIVTITDANGDTQTITTTVKPDGTYEVTPDQPIADGDYTAEAEVKTDGGSDKATDTGSVDTQKPDPVGLKVTDDVGPKTGDIQNGDTTDDTQPTIGGTGEAGATVEVVIDGGTPITTTVQDDGTWTITDPTLTDGEHTISVTQTDEAGNKSDPTDLTFTVDTQKPDPVGLKVTDDVGPKTGDIQNGDTTDDTQPTIGGTGEAGATVEVVIDGGTPITTTVQDDGTWTITDPTLTDGEHTISVTQADEAGNKSDPTDLTFTVDTVKPQVPDITISDLQLKTGDVADVTITFSEAVSGFDVSSLDVANGTVTGLSSSDGGKTWTGKLTATANIEDSSNVITVKAGGYQDAAGNLGVAKSSANYTVDTIAPTVETITMDNTALKAGDTATVTFTFSEKVKDFTASDVTTSGGTLSEPTTSDGGKTWTATFTPTANSQSTNNTVSVKADSYFDFADETGNKGTGGSGSSPVSFDIDTRDITPPTQAVNIAQVLDDQLPQPMGIAAYDTSGNVNPLVIAHNGTTNDSTPIVKGTLSAALADGTTLGVSKESLRIFANGKDLSNPANLDTAKDNSGNTLHFKDGSKLVFDTSTAWTFYDNSQYADGVEVTYTAKVQDEARLSSTVSNEYVVHLNTEASPVVAVGAISDGTANNLGDRVNFTPSPDAVSVRVFNSRGEDITNTADGAIIKVGSTWRMTGLTQELNYGETLTIRSFDADGNISEQSAFRAFGSGTGSGSGSLPDYSITIDSVIDDSSGNNMEAGAITNDLALSLSGSLICSNASSGANFMNADYVRVAIYDNGNYIGNAKVNVDGTANGSWTFDYGEYAPASYVAGSQHSFTASVLWGDAAIDQPVGIFKTTDAKNITVHETAAAVSTNEQLKGVQANGDNITHLKLSDLTVSTGSGPLKILGDEGDVLDIGISSGKGWIETGKASLGGVTYNVMQHYDGSAYEQILVQNTITLL
ncbi:MAG: Ig-like domain-containing protein [Neisseria sp.]|nr:Ig-like domain-containing protein [Neisseria sp.]